MDPRTATLAARAAAELDQAEHGAKEAIVQAMAAELGISVKTAYKRIAEVRGRTRTRRADHGELALTAEEAATIGAYLAEGYRANNKRRAIPLDEAVDVLRANGEIVAGRIDPDTGEIFYLSLSQISRSLKRYVMHPEQTRKPSPASSLATDHPNHMWQIDTSVCALYYLPGGGAWIEEVDPGAHYKNKPHNLRAIEEHRVIRYVLSDHTTNMTRWRYYPGAECGEHTARFLAWAMAPKPDASIDPFEGVPRVLYVDLGIGSNSLIKRFCARLGIDLKCHKPRNSRATGSVENGQWRVEQRFELGLRNARNRIDGLDALNEMAHTYQLAYNARASHSRHGMTRIQAWLHITPEQLVRTQPEAILLALATREPETRKVNDQLHIKYEGHTWCVKSVPGVLVGGTVRVHRHPFVDGVMAVTEDEQGREVHTELRDVTGVVDPASGQWGFAADAARPGEYKAKPGTEATTNRKALALLASGAETQEEDAKRRKAKDFTPFGGRIDPVKPSADYLEDAPAYLRKCGTDLDVGAPQLELVPLTHIQAAKALKAQMGDLWTPEHLAQLQRRYPAGVPEADLDLLLAEWRDAKAPAHQVPVLKVVK